MSLGHVVDKKAPNIVDTRHPILQLKFNII